MRASTVRRFTRRPRRPAGTTVPPAPARAANRRDVGVVGEAYTQGGDQAGQDSVLQSALCKVLTWLDVRV